MVAAEVSDGAPEIARRALVEQHLIINATGPTTLRFLPPLIVGAEQIDDALSRLAAVPRWVVGACGNAGELRR